MTATLLPLSIASSAPARSPSRSDERYNRILTALKAKRGTGFRLPFRTLLGGECLAGELVSGRDFDLPGYSAASMCGSTDTVDRLLARVLKETVPSTVAKIVWSTPMPTPEPGCHWVPR